MSYFDRLIFEYITHDMHDIIIAIGAGKNYYTYFHIAFFLATCIYSEIVGFVAWFIGR